MGSFARASKTAAYPAAGVLLILLAAALLRFVDLGSNPAGVFHDEAEKGYSAYSLLALGGTLQFTNPAPNAHGVLAPAFHRRPLFIDVWGSLTSMVYQYAALPFVAALGLGAWSVRLPAAIVGTATVLLTFFLARGLTGRRSTALWAMALMAFSPWHVVFSRWAQQGIFVPFFLCCALLAFLRVRDDPRRRAFAFLLLAALFFGLALYSYAGAMPFLLLFWPMTALVWRREIRAHWKGSLAALALLAIVSFPTVRAILGGGGAGMGRFHALSIFQLDATPLVKTLLFVKNYLAHFSPQFLFLSGDHLDRHGVRGFGAMLHVELLFLAVGIYTALKRRSTADRFLLGWFLLYPLSAALTNEGVPHALRTLHAVPCPQILSAMGVVAALDWARRRWGAMAKWAVAALVAADALAFAVVLFVYYPHYSAPAFEYGVREALAVARAQGRAAQSDYRIYVPADNGIPLVPELYYFHERTDPRLLLRQGLGASHLRFLPRQPTAAEANSLLRPGDSLIASPMGSSSIMEGMGAGIGKHAVRWRPRPFSQDQVTVLVVLSR